MSSLDLIAQLEPRLSAYLRLSPIRDSDQDWLLQVQLFYDSKPAGNTNFNLIGHSAEEAESVARNLKHNAYLMREIDEYLWGESD